MEKHIVATLRHGAAPIWLRTTKRAPPWVLGGGGGVGGAGNYYIDRNAPVLTLGPPSPLQESTNVGALLVRQLADFQKEKSICKLQIFLSGKAIGHIQFIGLVNREIFHSCKLTAV